MEEDYLLHFTKKIQYSIFIAIKPLLRFPIKCKVNRILKPTAIELGSSIKYGKSLKMREENRQILVKLANIDIQSRSILSWHSQC